MKSEEWQVDLNVDGIATQRIVVIEPPFGIRCADAEVKAIREAERLGGKKVRATRSRYLRDLPPPAGKEPHHE